MKNTIIGMLILASLLTSCQKETGKTGPTKETIQGSYRVTAVNTGGVNNFDNPDPSQNYFEPCAKDDLHRLNPDGTYQLIDEGVICSPDNDQDSGTWKLVNATTLEIDGFPSTIKSFDGRTLILVTASPMGNTEFSFVKQ